MKETSFGEFYFERAILLKQSILLKSILCNTEVLYGMKNIKLNNLKLLTNICRGKLEGVGGSENVMERAA